MKILPSIRNAIKKLLETAETETHTHIALPEFPAEFIDSHKLVKQAYDELTQLISEHLEVKIREKILSKKSDNFLKAVLQAWHFHDKSMINLSRALGQLDTIIESNPLVLDNVYDLGVKLFFTKILGYEEIQVHFSETILDKVTKNWEIVDHLDIKCVGKMLRRLKTSDLSLYEEYFEIPFSEMYKEFYLKKSKNVTPENNLSAYILKIKNLFQEKNGREVYLMQQFDIEKFNIEDEMIKNITATIVECEEMSKLVDMLNIKATKDLVFFSRLFDPCWPQILRECNSHFIRKNGEELIMKENETNPITFFKNLLNTKERYHHFPIKALNNDETYKKTITSDFEYILNLDQKSTEHKIKKIVDESTKNIFLNASICGEMTSPEYTFKSNSIDDLTCMCKLFKDMDNWTEKLGGCIIENLRKEGEQFIRNRKGTNPIMFVQNLLNLKRWVDIFTLTMFSNYKIFEPQAVGTLTYQYVNLDENTPEYLSLFIDHKLRKGFDGLSEAEIESVEDKILALFQYLKEKDIFNWYYQRHLAKRLLKNLSVWISDDREQKIILKLKVQCGKEFTKNFEWMCKDVNKSKRTMEEFRMHMASARNNLHGIDFKVLVFGTKFWPLKFNYEEVLIPKGLFEAFTLFQSFYLGKHNGRKLTLNPNFVSADLNAVFYGPERRETNEKECEISSQSSTNAAAGSNSTPRNYIIEVLMYQMCILLLFNNKDKVTYEEICQTQIPETAIKSALESMSLGKHSQRILTKSPMTKDIEPLDTFIVNESFTSKFTRIKIKTVQPAKFDSETEREKNLNRFNAERQYEIDAAIMRIMKVKKVLSCDDLIVQCIEKLKSRFTPRPEVIKIRIERLIELEFLAQKVGDDGKVLYTYVP